MTDELDPRLSARFERELDAAPAFRGMAARRADARPRWMTFAALGTAAVVALTIVVAAATRAVLTPASSSGSIAVAGQDLAALVRASDVVVVGTVLSAGGTRVVSRDPNDLSREDPNYVSIAQDYSFAVESSIKGTASGTVTITISSASRVRRGPFWYDFTSERIPPRVGSRYVLFLRTLAWDASVYVLNFEPSQFELGAVAEVRSVWREAKTYFPDRPVPGFIQAVRDAAKAPPP